MLAKNGIGKNVLDAARERIAFVFDRFTRVYVSFSGGKDSTVLLNLTLDEARSRSRKIGVLFVDLEAQYRSTIDFILNTLNDNADVIEPFWCSLPLNLRNAVSQFEPQWCCWDPRRKDDWVRTPPDGAITDEDYFPFFRRQMEFEEFVPAFGEWYARGVSTCCLVGIRCDESINRFRSIVSEKKARLDGLGWTTRKSPAIYNAYPIYDWKTSDIWKYHADTGRPYNGVYDLMHKAGLTPAQMRICQPYGDDQRKGLWLYHVLEPETWARVVARVNGANQGALYALESGNILGRIKISKPAGHTWQSYVDFLLASMPPQHAEHYKDKIAVFLKWYEQRGYAHGIPDEVDPKLEALRKVPSWRRVAKTILKNDYWCKTLSFNQHKSEAYERYVKVIRNRRRRWGL